MLDRGGYRTRREDQTRQDKTRPDGGAVSERDVFPGTTIVKQHFYKLDLRQGCHRVAIIRR